MLPVFENVFDVLAFLVHHFPYGFQNIEDRHKAIKKIEEANPLTPKRKAEEEARIEAEREKDTGRVTVSAAHVSTPAYSQADIDAAAQRAVAAYIANQNAYVPEQKDTPGFTVTPSFVPESDASQ